jgi:hypothetical protein
VVLPLGGMNVKQAVQRGIWEELMAYFPSIRHGPHRKRVIHHRPHRKRNTGKLGEIHRMDTKTRREKGDLVSFILFSIRKVV